VEISVEEEEERRNPQWFVWDGEKWCEIG